MAASLPAGAVDCGPRARWISILVLTAASCGRAAQPNSATDAAPSPADAGAERVPAPPSALAPGSREAGAAGPADAGQPADCDRGPGPVRLAWRDAASKLVLATSEFACLSDAERAALGRVSATVGSDCEWAKGTKLSSPEHLDCKLTTALGLGYQCEEKHKAHVKAFLGSDVPAQCARIPITAFAQTALDELTLRRGRSEIVVRYKATTTEGPMGKAWTWSETIGFQDKGSGALRIAWRKPVGNRSTPP